MKEVGNTTGTHSIHSVTPKSTQQLKSLILVPQWTARNGF